MMNLFYRGYVIHEDITSICYTIYGPKPHRYELRSRGTTLEAMRSLARALAELASLRRVRRVQARQISIQPSSLAQPALL